jgi:streptomycin 6-kinase
MTTFTVPRYLAETARGDDGVREWITALPSIVADLAGRWSLRVGEPFQPGGQCSWTAPVTGPAGTCLVLKVGYRFPGGDERDEAAGLRVWAGNGAVRLQAAAETELARALLIERCLPGTPLGQARPELEQDLIVAALLRRLWAQPHAAYPFRPLAQMCADWAREFERDYAAAAPADRIDPGLARAGIALFRELPETAGSRVLLCTDLHGDNILAAQRAPWLVIDPKPYLGDPAYDVLQHMLNCEGRLAADPAGLAARMAGLTGVEAVRVRHWLFARSVQESVGSPLMRQVARALAPG